MVKVGHTLIGDPWETPRRKGGPAPGETELVETWRAGTFPNFYVELLSAPQQGTSRLSPFCPALALASLASNGRPQDDWQSCNAWWNSQPRHGLGCRECLKSRLRTETPLSPIEELSGERHALLGRECHRRMIISCLLVCDLHKPKIPLYISACRKITQVEQAF